MTDPRSPNTGAGRGKPVFTPNKNDGTQPAEPDWWRGKPDQQNNVRSSSNVENQYDDPDRNRGASAIPKDPSTSGRNSNHSSMIEKSVTLGKDSYIIKGYLTCGNQQLFALECERSISGYNGICPSCHGEHMRLAESRGYYASIDSIYGAIETKKLEKERLKGRQKVEDLKTIEGNLPPLDHEIVGPDKGIEGDSNSCYMDSTIFCMFAYSNVFDSLLRMEIHDNDSVTKLQKLLKHNIVNVLRSEKGFVKRDAMFHLRVFLSEATGDQTFKEVEKDPSEFLRALESLFHYAPLKTIPSDQSPNKTASNVTTNIMWEMFDANPEKLPSTSIGSIFRNSLAENSVKLATIPPFLILVAPRHTRSQRSYRYIIPDLQIVLDHKIVQHVCIKCEQESRSTDQSRDFYHCYECYSKESSLLSSPPTDNIVMCYCDGCLAKLHKDLPTAEAIKHQPKQMKNKTYKLNLFAVLCIETSHYVAFVKCRKSEQNHEWLFFDSMSDRIHNEKNVPRVSRVHGFDKSIKDAEEDRYYFEDLDKRRQQGKPTSQAFTENEMRHLRLFRDGAFFFYENSEANYQ